MIYHMAEVFHFCLYKHFYSIVGLAQVIGKYFKIDKKWQRALSYI